MNKNFIVQGKSLPVSMRYESRDDALCDALTLADFLKEKPQ